MIKLSRRLFPVVIILLMVGVVVVEDIWVDKAAMRMIIEVLLIAGVGLVLYYWFREDEKLVSKLRITLGVLKRSQAQYRMIVENTEDLIAIISPEGKYIYVSGAYERVLGYKRKKLVGLVAESLVREEDRRGYKRQFVGAAKGKEVAGRVRLRRKDGEWVYVEGKRKGILDDNGRVVAYISLARNISQLMEVEKRKDDFIGIASHELRTPVTSLKLYAGELIKKVGVEGEEGKLAKKMNSAVDRLTDLISRLLDVSRIESGKLQLQLEEVTIEKLVEEMAGEVAATDGQHKIEVRPGSGATTVVADKQRIAQVLVNLLVNACKYSPGADKVEVSVEREKNKIRVKVRDFGIGISRGNLTKVFERRFREKGVEGNTDGLGLGLYVCREIIKKHRGTMGVKSQVGKGSEFWFELPALSS